MNRKTVFAVVAVALLILLAGCGGDAGGSANVSVNATGGGVAEETTESGGAVTTASEDVGAASAIADGDASPAFTP